MKVIASFTAATPSFVVTGYLPGYEYVFPSKHWTMPYKIGTILLGYVLAMLVHIITSRSTS